MKRSETPADVQTIRASYIRERWTQLSAVANSYGEEGVKYLLVVNTAAMGATLGFFGAMPHLRPLLWPKIVLLLFAFGVAILGLYHSFRYHRIEWIFAEWRAATLKYGEDAIEWNDLIDGDLARSKTLAWIQGALAYASLLSFYAGLLIAAVHFGEISPPSPLLGGKDDRPQIERPAKTESAKTEPAKPPESPAPGATR